MEAGGRARVARHAGYVPPKNGYGSGKAIGIGVGAAAAGLVCCSGFAIIAGE